jgi:hypothetical protein
MMMNRFWGSSMKKTQIYILVIAATIYLLATAEGTGISGTVPPAGSAVDQPRAVSFNATPVQYAQVNGVTLGYREFDPVTPS